MSLPPLPGLIPISSFSLKNVKQYNLREVEKEVMGEQRSRRINSEASDDLIDNSPSSQAPRSGKTRRKSQRKQKQVNDHNKVNPRVNPIFVWVRQENYKIVDVKCEDYDKRNRIVLTKTPQGWRAMPRTETLAPNLKAAVICEAMQEEEKPRKSKRTHHHRQHKVKRKSAAVQVDDCQTPTRESPDLDIETQTPTLLIETAKEPEKTEEVIQNKCEVTSPLDNLLAVAELEFNQQIQEESKNHNIQDDSVDEEEAKIEDCDYNEDDDIVMNQILMQLEQSLQSPETLEASTVNKTVEEPEEILEDEECEEEYLEDNTIDDQPTDLSMPKAVSPRPPSRCSIVIQSPQPSGLPPVPPSPDVHKIEQKFPESEESISSSLPEKKYKSEEDVTLRAMLTKDEKQADSKSTSAEPSRLLELLMSPEVESPLTQLKHLLTDSTISMPDPLLIPKNRLAAILTSPGKEIPRLLYQRPELRLPEALKHADLLKNPDILVITVHQLKTILQKQSLDPDEKVSLKPQEKPMEAHTLKSLLKPTTMISWLPYLQQLEMAAMSFGHQDFLKMLKSSQNSMAAFPPNFPMMPPQVLPQVPPSLPHFYPHHNQFEYPIYQQFIPPSKNHCCSAEKARPPPKYTPYFNPQQMRSSLQVPQYNPGHHRNQKYHSTKISTQSSHPSEKNVYRDKCSESMHQTRHHTQPQQPIDLSGANSEMIKRSKFNQRLNYCDPPVGAKTNLRYDDNVPEVGSTTASIEDFSMHSMQEPPKNVWNPLFTSSKASSNSNSWNWPTSVTATGE